MSVFIPIVLLDRVSFKLNRGYSPPWIPLGSCENNKFSAREIQLIGSPSSYLGSSTLMRAYVVDVVGLSRNEITSVDKRWGGEEDGCDCCNLGQVAAAAEGKQQGLARKRKQEWAAAARAAVGNDIGSGGCARSRKYSNDWREEAARGRG
ncbi:hypothetical protein B296_00055435 [Ensete ventricosum]|uniref:Uncharacterized protein n=1 Tax=Ensete ventricosum TaxID=4639 RepID=A0A426X8W5_ENSVE|nr:hypothetical protein B296_00055435 [Ensete ventricosum]